MSQSPTTHSKKRKSDSLDHEDDDGEILATKKVKLEESSSKPSIPKNKLHNAMSAEPGLVHENYNEALTKLLAELGSIEKNKGNLYKSKAYQQAVASLKAHPAKIENGAEAMKLPGIGVKIGKKIDEILSTGQLARLNKELNDPRIAAINDLSRIPGVGPAFAQKLVLELGIQSVDQLRENAEVCSQLNHHQQLGLKYLEDLEKRVPRDEITKIFHIIKKEAASISPKLIVKCCGSYRRKLPSSGDIDILITHPDWTTAIKEADELNRKAHKPTIGTDWLSKLVEKLQSCKLLVENVSHGHYKYQGLCRLDSETPIRQIDLKMFPYDSFFCGLLHFTGSGEHNRQLRIIAEKKGYKLSEYGLYPVSANKKVGLSVPISSEKDVFEILEVAYRKPEERSI